MNCDLNIVLNGKFYNNLTSSTEPKQYLVYYTKSRIFGQLFL